MINNIQMNPFAVSNLLVFITSFSLAIFIFLYGKTKLTKIYCLHAFSIGVWGLAAFFALINRDPNISFIFWKVSYCGVIFIPIFFLHAVFLLNENFNKPLLLFSYSQGFIFLVLNITGVIFKHVNFMFNSFYYIQGEIIFLISFIIWILLVLFSHYLLIKFYKKRKDKIYLIFIVTAIIGFSGGFMNFLPAFNINIYPFGNFLIPLYVIIVAYSIFKYQIFNINLIFHKGFVYSCLVAIITATYFIFVFLTERFFKSFIGYQSLIVSILYAFVIALFFNPVKNKIQNLADIIFLGKTPQQIAQENELLRQELIRSDKLKAVAALASGMAHEIKNPLTAIKTFTEYLPQKTDDKEFLTRFSKIVGPEVEKIDNLVHQLLDFSKPAPLQLKETDIHRLIDDTLELLSSQFIKYRIQVNKHYYTNIHESNTNKHELIRDDSSVISVNSCKIKVDPQQIKQVFLNLFLNAIEAMPSGGTLTVSTKINDSGFKIHDTGKNKEPASCIMHPESKWSIEICVQDSGCGIPEKDLTHIFEPFYTTKEKGSGLGLSIVYNIIKEHKGIVLVESELDKGTEFIIELPIT